jgi:dTDP-4-dehydrorhamnose reductase
VDACEDDQENCWDINVTAVRHLLKSAKKHGSHLIHLSTDFVFDGEEGPYEEKDKPNPLSYYAKSKLASEKLINESNYRNTAIARTIIVFGNGDNLSRGNLIFWAKGALEKQAPINVVDDQFRSPTLAEDLAKGCILIADKDATGLYHLSGPVTYSILEIVERIGKYYDLSTDCVTPIKTATLNQKAARPPRTGFIIDKAKNDLGYNPLDLEEALSFLDNQI